MTNEDSDRAKLRLDEERLELEKARLQLENSFSKKYGTPLLSILGAIVVGVFALAQVWIASIQKDKEIAVAQIQKAREIDLATSERERRWKLDIADFIFRNKEVIFSADTNEEQQRIIKVIAVTFPIDVAGIILENVKAAVPDEQKPLWEAGQRLAEKIERFRAERCCYYRLGWCKPWTLRPGRDAAQVEYAELNSLCYCPGDEQGSVGQYCP